MKMRTTQASTSKVAKAPKSSKASKQAKSCGLSVNTITTHVDGQVSSARGEENVTQTSSSILHKERLEATTAKSKKKAILTDNWRVNQFERLGGVSLPPAAGIPATAAPDKTEFQLAGGKKNAKKLSIDTDRAGEYGLRRYRDTPVDPDFIFSAPITKKDFNGAQDETDPPNTEESQEPASDASLTTPSVVPKSADIAKQPIVPMSAEIKTFKSAKKLNSDKWDSIPHTASLPIDRMRLEMDHAVALKAILEERFFNTSSSGGETTNKEEDDARYNAFLAKLRRSQLVGGRRRGRSFIDIKPPHWTKESGKVDTESSSRGSATSAIPDDDGKKGPMLNPKAAEFRSTISLDESNGSNFESDPQSGFKENYPQQGSLPDSYSKDSSSSKESALVEEVRAVNARMVELMEEIKQMKVAQQYSYPVEHGRDSPFINPPQYGQHQGQAQGPVPFGPHGSALWSAAQSYNTPQQSMQQPRFPYISQNMSPGGSIQPPSIPPPRVHQLRKAFLPDRSSTHHAPMPSNSHQAGHAPLPLHEQAQMIFGPKPVSKPRGYFRPGDPRAAEQQVAYESYLEQKRASNVAYAMQCRERQARRAQRQRMAFANGNNAPKAPFQQA